jgi:hypothetical protein
MLATCYRQELCAKCVTLVRAPHEVAAHRSLGRPRAEVGYDLYRCAVCHTRWSHSLRGWVAETS